MNEDDLFEYDEDKLPNINLSEQQKNRIRKSLFKNIKRLNENNYNLEIDNSLDNLIRIQSKLGKEKDLVIHGVKHAKVLKELALQSVNKDCPLNKNTIIYENFFHIGYGMEAKYSTHSVMYSSLYCYIYISKDFLVTYSFDGFFRLQHKHIIKLTDIDFIKISNRSRDGIKLSHYNLMISISNLAKESVSTIYLVNSSSKDDIEEAKDILTLLGVKYLHEELKYSSRVYLYYLIWIFVAVIFYLYIAY